MTIENRRLFIEYTGTWPNYCWHYDGRACPFWTLADGRQVGDAGTEEAYRYILSTEDNIRPFVPKGENDWTEINEIARAKDKELEEALRREEEQMIRRQVKDSISKATAMMKHADDMELESQRLRNEVVRIEEETRTLLAQIETEPAPAPAPPPKSPPKPKKKASAKPKKE